jgi:hypothetical protein
LATISLYNNAQIDINLNQLDIIVQKSRLPDGRVFLIFHDDCLPDNKQGACLPPKLLSFSRSFKIICDKKILNNCDVSIALSKRACSLYENFPAYFFTLLDMNLATQKYV